MASAKDFAIILNLTLDILNIIRRVAPEITPANIDSALKERQAEVDALDKRVNE